MDRNIVLFCGGSVNDGDSLVNMKRSVLNFSTAPCFNELMERVKGIMQDGCQFGLRGRYDAGTESRPYHVIVLLLSEDD